MGKSTIYAIDDPNYRGLLYVEPERLYQLAKLCLEKDLQFTAHSVGDGAVHALLQAYDAIDKDFPVRPTRPCITHCNFMSREAIETMKRLGVVADLHRIGFGWMERPCFNSLAMIAWHTFNPTEALSIRE